MSQRVRLLVFLAGAAFVSGAICTVVLWALFHGPRYIDMVVGSYSPWLLISFPFIAAALTAFWGSLFKVATFGLVQGALVAALALVTFCALLNALHGGGGLERFGALLLAALVFFGWALVLVGAAAGWFFRRTRSAAL